MDKKEEQRLINAFTEIATASSILEKAVKKLAKFRINVPSLHPGAIEMMAEETNSISKSVAFIRSFVRVSTLQQIVPMET